MMNYYSGADDVDQAMSRPARRPAPKPLRPPRPQPKPPARASATSWQDKYLPNSPGQCATMARRAYCHPCICGDMRLNYETQ